MRALLTSLYLQMYKRLTVLGILVAWVGLMHGQQGESTEPTLSTQVLFDFARHAIRPDADSALAKFTEQLADQTLDSIRVIAHTDAIGSVAANHRLSRQRAESVRSWLGTHGVDTTLVHLRWKGELDSVAVNTSDDGRQRNRRATIQAFAAERYTEITGSVKDSLDRGIPARIVVHGSAFVDSTRADSAGFFALMVPDSTVLGLDIFHPGYLYTTEMFKSGTRRSRQLNYKPRPIERNVSFDLHRFYFVGNKAVLLPKSEPELHRLLRFMQMNPTVAISIEGHVNFPNQPKCSRDSWEFDLSFRRARLVYMFLVDQGIDPARLTFDGFGNWHMVYPRARVESQMAKNRRVEIRITDY